MDFRRLTQALPPMNTTQNSPDAASLTALPSNLLDALIPGYSIISGYAQAYLGFDISITVTAALIAIAIFKGSQYLYSEAEKLFCMLFMSSVHIDEHDDLFDMVMSWLAQNRPSSSKRSVRAKTMHGSRDDDALNDSVADALGPTGLFDYNKWNARTPPRYEPYYGRHMIWYNGRLFFFRRSQRQPQGTRVQVTWGAVQEDDILQIDCIGRSTNPIRELLRVIKTSSLDRLRGTTVIRHPTPKDRARYGGSWSKTSSRPSRPMDTVILDEMQKQGIIQDMNEYLHPSSPAWYARRGIPYRRGYLFHGPPGTGKTSLSFALAGIFGLEIYAISLQEPTLTEGDLMMLFNGLSRRCIVLLEDIDAAGLLRDDKSDDAEKSTSKAKTKSKRKTTTATTTTDKKSTTTTTTASTTDDANFTLKDFARELKSLISPDSTSSPSSTNTTNPPTTIPSRSSRGTGPQIIGHPNRAPGTGISLSGLLNAIDGVATHEGRVLIMTTNHPERLDAALVRPGRVDRRVEFRLARCEQVRELFVRMYAVEGEVAAVGGKKLAGRERKGGKENGGVVVAVANGGVRERRLADMEVADLEAMAAEFAALIPDDTFTPAEIQNLLMRHKLEPWEAVRVAEEWVKTTLAEKEAQNAVKEKVDEGDEDGDEDEKEGDGKDE